MLTQQDANLMQKMIDQRDRLGWWDHFWSVGCGVFAGLVVFAVIAGVVGALLKVRL